MAYYRNRAGEEIGKEIGEKNAKAQMAQRMLAAHKFTVEDISMYTGLPINDIEQLQQTT